MSPLNISDITSQSKMSRDILYETVFIGILFHECLLSSLFRFFIYFLGFFNAGYFSSMTILKG